MSFRSGEDSHIQLILLVLYSRGLSTSKETQKQAAELPEAELKWDSRSQASLVKGLSSGKGPQSRWELCVSIPATPREWTPRRCEPEKSLMTNRKNYNISERSGEYSSLAFGSCVPEESGPEEKERGGVYNQIIPRISAPLKKSCLLPSGVQLEDGTGWNESEVLNWSDSKN